MVERGDMLSVEDVQEILGLKPIGIVPEDEKVLISSNEGEPLVLKNGSIAGNAFMDVARRIRGEEVPFPDLREKSGLMGALRKLLGGG
jgi:septum site-determining protein MinD